MPAQNLVSATISPEVKSEVLKKLTDVRGHLDFLLTLQTDEIRSLMKASNSYHPFISKSYNAIVDHPDIMPAVFDLDEFKRDYHLSQDLAVIGNQVKELAEAIQNTQIAVNSDAMNGALEVYSAVKQNKDKVPGLNVVAEELAEFFKRSKRKKTEETEY